MNFYTKSLIYFILAGKLSNLQVIYVYIKYNK